MVGATLDLAGLVSRTSPPIPWQEGANIPWNDPGFSARMLDEHLDQTHDAASRPFSVIDRHVTWIHTGVLGQSPSRVLDLGCGPGLYTSRLSAHGHGCVGIDYSPASIAYARTSANEAGLSCHYIEADLTVIDDWTTALRHPFDVAMLLYGELNVFPRHDALAILTGARAALSEGGRLILEVHTEEKIRENGARDARWWTSPRGLFSDRPHLGLTESFWDGARQVATVRYFVMDAKSGAITRYAASYQAYTEDELEALLGEAGFFVQRRSADFGGEGAEDDYVTVVART